MGTDMHLIVEHFKDPSKKWKRVSPPTEEPFCGYWYPGRCYSLFSILADVRNFPRCYGLYEKIYGTKDKMLEPIFPYRGLPEGICTQTAVELDSLYSITWYTLDELLSFDWNQIAGVQDSIATKDSYESWKKGEEISIYGGSSESILVSHEEMEKLITEGIDIEPRVVTVVRWTETYREAASEFLDLLELLRERFDDPSKIRLIMGFC